MQAALSAADDSVERDGRPEKKLPGAASDLSICASPAFRARYSGGGVLSAEWDRGLERVADCHFGSRERAFLSKEGRTGMDLAWEGVRLVEASSSESSPLSQASHLLTCAGFSIGNAAWLC